MTEQQQQQQPVGVYLTSTTAPGKTFANRMELAQHYKSNYHKYNLKRREAGLPLLVETDFMARLAAAHAVQFDKQQQKNKKNTDHIKKDKKDKNRQKDKHKQQQQKGEKNKQLLSQQEELLDEPDGKQRQRQEQDQKKEPVQPEDGQRQQEEERLAATDASRKETSAEAVAEGDHNNNNKQTETIIEIDPRQCLFDHHISKSVTSNVERMQRKYGFFVPDREYLQDMVGLVGYCHEIIQFEHFCLYCYKQFHTARACQQHMISKRHTKIRYEHGYDIENLDVFYDFSNANEEFWNYGNNNNINNKKKPENTAVAAAVTTTEEENDDDDDMEDGGNNDDDNDDEWEDITDDEGDGDDEDQNDDDDDDDLYRGYEEEVTRMGLDVTALGELVFPDGRIIGHRSLRRYYKQKLRNPQSSSTAVAAAQQAAGERLYKGRVYQIGYNSNNDPTSNHHETGGGGALALARAGIAPGWASGRAGQGILVSSAGNNNSCYSQVSIYRYRAALRKQRRGELQGKRIHEKTNQNINHMDKKHNRLMNGVSVAHAAR